MMASDALRCPPPVSENRNSTWACLGCGWLIGSSWDDGLQAAGQFAPGQNNATFTGQALQADIRSHPHHLPLIATTGMRLTQPDHVLQAQLRQHVKIIPPPLLPIGWSSAAQAGLS